MLVTCGVSSERRGLAWSTGCAGCRASQPGLRCPNNMVCFRNVPEMSARLPGLAPSCHRRGRLSLLLVLAFAVLGEWVPGLR